MVLMSALSSQLAKSNMKHITIKGANYSNNIKRIRYASRAIIIKDDMILTSHEEVTNQYMLPGGGREMGESDRHCVIRETMEETGLIIKPSRCLLEINELYEDVSYISRYYFGEIVGTCERHLTEREKEVNMNPKWIKIDELIKIFSTHNDYKDTDEMRRGLYLRELTALNKILKKADK